MGLTAEAVAKQFNVSQVKIKMSLLIESHMKALKAQAEGKFDAQIVPISSRRNFYQ